MFKSLQGKLTLLFAAFVLLVVVSVGAMMWGSVTQTQDALLINLAGRQRMLAQQMTRLAFEAGAGEEAANTALREAMQAFDRSLYALRDGGMAAEASATLPVTRDAGIRSALDEAILTWGNFRVLLDEVQQTPRDDPSFSTKLEEIEKESSVLVERADAVVNSYEANALAKVNRLRAMQVGFLVGALILLAAGAWVTRQSALAPLRELARATSRLGEDDLDTAVQVEGPTEMRVLSESIDTMRKKLLASRINLLDLNSTLETRVAQRTRELDALHEVSREIASQLDVQFVLKSVTDKARTLLEGDVAMLCLLDEEKQYLSLKSVSGFSFTAVDRTSTFNRASAVLTSRHALVCNNAECVGGCNLLAQVGVASHIVAPLRIGDNVIGALCVSSAQPNRFSNESADVVTKLANTAAIAFQNAQLYAQAERVAMLEERHRLAAEMHDGLGQTLSYLGMMTEQTTQFLSRGQDQAALDRLEKTRETIERATVEVRGSINNLMDETSTELDFSERLKNVIDTFAEEAHLSVAWSAESSPRCSSRVADQALNVAREALKNVARHAEAQHVHVRLGQENGHHAIVIEDDGKGFDTSQPEPSGHFGLQIIRARAAHIGGSAEIESLPGHGTRITLTWPEG